MTGQDPETLLYFAYAAVAMGVVMLTFGQVQKRSDDPAKVNAGHIMMWGGLGWFVASAICYFGNMHDWVLIPALAAFFVVSGVGQILFVRRVRAAGKSAVKDIVS